MTPVVVLTTVGANFDPAPLATQLVEMRLAACVNIIPQIESVYRWKDEIESSREWLLVIKTTASLFERFRDEIGKLHSYEIPECIEIAIEDGSPAYLEWITKSVTLP